MHCCSHNHIQLVLHDGEPVFFNQRDGPFMPTLKLLHKVPHVMKHVRADKGAIPFVLSGANVMCPGLTSAGGDMPESLAVGTPVVGAFDSALRTHYGGYP
ncbi:hypothetical protein BBJ28_00002897 [Nothophytophthora sp. Chile5]|nr:hypothetical protein BBJ28_00002897 [Nothophytophthora sp. Chile5]